MGNIAIPFDEKHALECTRCSELQEISDTRSMSDPAPVADEAYHFAHA